jgi:hypothetical protein
MGEMKKPRFAADLRRPLLKLGGSLKRCQFDWLIEFSSRATDIFLPAANITPGWCRSWIAQLDEDDAGICPR